MNEVVVRFEHVYESDAGQRGTHLHAPGMCDHTKGLVPARQDELLSLDQCGQCLNRAEELGVLVTPSTPLQQCPTCFMVSPCECEN